MHRIIQALRASPLFAEVEVLELIDETSVRLIKIKATVKDGSLLFITELQTRDYQKYSYHWQQADGALIRRWDNKPHWRNMATFPHHRHEGKTAYPSHRVTIEEVLQEINKSVS